MQRLAAWGILAALSFVPALLFMLWARSRERHGREPFGAVLGVFVHGATLGVAMAIALSVLAASSTGGSALMTAIVVAPLVEEATKAAGFAWVRRHMDEVEDGLVYGISVGLGFAATETLLYGLLQLGEADVASAVGTVALRNASSMFLHAGSSALLGYGYARVQAGGASGALLLPAYLAAAGLHALYNALVLTAGWGGFLAAMALAVAVTGILLAKLRRLDRDGPASPGPS